MLRNHYHIPIIYDLLDQLKNVVYFTKLDLRSGYHHIIIAEGNIWKTSFKTKQGLFEWVVMPFGLCNAPTTFMRVMNDVFQPYIDDFFIVYLDDILIFSRRWEYHIKHIKIVFDLLKKDKLYIKLSKCEFGKTSLVCLGYIVGNGHLNIDPTKVEVIIKWPNPTTTIEVRIFLVVVEYWRKFIAELSYIATPLHELTSIKQNFQWGGKQQKAFETLKGKISTTPILALPYLQ
jgi:hypothetical protein